MQLEASAERNASTRSRVVCDRTGSGRDLDGRRRHACAAVADAHSAVSAHPHRDDSDTYRVDADFIVDDAEGAIALRVDDAEGAIALRHAQKAGVRTGARRAYPRRLCAHLAAAAAFRLCLLDWSDHGPPFG
jgi:hypothetical protein